MQGIPDLIRSFLRDGISEENLQVGLSTNNTLRAREEYLIRVIREHNLGHGTVTPASTFIADLLQIEMHNFRGV